MIAPVSALSSKIRYQIEPGMPHNAIRLHLDDGCSITVAPQVGSVDLVDVVHLSYAIKTDINHWMTSAAGEYRGTLGLTLKLNRYRGKIGTRPLILAYHNGEFMRAFIPQQRIVAAEQVYEHRLAS